MSKGNKKKQQQQARQETQEQMMQQIAQIFPSDVLEGLSQERVVTDLAPWCWQSENKVVNFYHKIFEQMSRQMGVQFEMASRHHGSGYASYITVCIHPQEKRWVRSQTIPGALNDTVLNVTLSRLSPYFIFDEREYVKQEGLVAEYAAEFMPRLAVLDKLKDARVQLLASDVQRLLEEQGLVRLYSNVLSEYLPEGSPCYTSMLMLLEGREHPCYFDALFHWED